jgi:hypothetical protein
VTAREVPLAEAAEALGLTTETLRQRLKRGKTLCGTKRPDGWYVLLDHTQLAGRPVAQPAATSHDPLPPAVNGHNQSQPDAVSSQLVDTLQAEVADLRQANSELRRQLAAALHQRVLPAPESTRVDPETVSPDTGSRLWWAALLWWSR